MQLKTFFKFREFSDVHRIRMAGAIIENMSGRKLAMIGSVLLLGQIFCFIIGAVLSPAPNNSNQHLGIKWFHIIRPFTKISKREKKLSSNRGEFYQIILELFF